MLKVAKHHFVNPQPELTLEAIVSDDATMEGWFFNRKKKKDANRELKRILENKLTVTDERKLDDLITSTLKEYQEALDDLGLVDSSDFTKTIVEKAKQVDKWMGTRFKKSSMASDMAARMKHLAYTNAGYGNTLSYYDIDIETTDNIQSGDILYKGVNLVLYANQYSEGPLHVVAEELWRFDYYNTKPSRARDKLVDGVRVGLREHLMHVYRKLDEEAIWTDNDGHVNYDWDLIEKTEDPYDAVFKYDRVLAEYPDGGGNSAFIVEERGEVVTIDIDHETMAIVVT